MSDTQDEKKLERELSELLTDGMMDAEKQDHQEEGRKRLPTKYEVRIQTQIDPILEETRKYRSMAKELDDRYDKYMDKSPLPSKDTDPEV